MFSLLRRLYKRFNRSFSYGYYGDLSVLFSVLNENNFNYVVLRSFEQLPAINPNDDVDILISDSDYPKLKKLLKRGRPGLFGFIKFDIYSVTNIDGHISYYPPYLSNKILNSKVVHNNCINIPGEDTYIFSLVYHFVFHKGFNSGLPSSISFDNGCKNVIKKDYKKILLSELLRNNFENVDITLESLEAFLKNNNWAPPIDVYYRRSKSNLWLSKFLKLNNHTSSDSHGYCVFLLREAICNNNFEQIFLEELEKNDCQIVEFYNFDVVQSHKIADSLRGGDWGSPSLESNFSGLPIHAYLVRSNTIASNIVESFPVGHVEYDWVKNIKSSFRERVNKNVPKLLQCHLLHSSDNGFEALKYVEIIKSIKS